MPDLSSFRVSTPVLSDALQAPPAEEKDQKGPPRAVHMVRRDFPLGENKYVFFQYDVYGAQKDKTSGMPKVTAGYVVKKKADGAVVTKVDPTPIQPTSIGRLSRFTATSMKDYTPGDYEIVLNLKDELSGKTLEYSEPFKVVPAGAASPAPRQQPELTRASEGGPQRAEGSVSSAGPEALADVCLIRIHCVRTQWSEIPRASEGPGALGKTGRHKSSQFQGFPHPIVRRGTFAGSRS